MDFLRGFDQEERALVTILTIPGKAPSTVGLGLLFLPEWLWLSL